jgi:hypothetical protein
LALLVAFAAAAQSRQLGFGGGLKLCALRDQAQSPLKYSGAGYEGFVGYRASNERKETIWLLSAGQANLSSAFDRQLRTHAIRLTNLNFYARAGEDKELQWGWGNNNGFHQRRIDDFQNFNIRVEFFTTFGPAARYTRHFSLWEQRFRFQAAAHVQLIGFYLPSGYVASVPAGFGYEEHSFAGAVLRSMRPFHPLSAFNGGLWPQLDWQLGSGNSIALNYLYEFTHFSRPHPTARSSGHWFLTFHMSL